MISYNGAPLPATIGPVPPNKVDGTPSGCNVVVTTGSLSLHPATAGFDLEYEFHDSCQGALLSRTQLGGTYSRDADRITFRIPGADTTIVHTGTIAGGRIAVMELVFERQ